MSTRLVARTSLALLLGLFVAAQRGVSQERTDFHPGEAEQPTFSDQVDVSLIEIEVTVSDRDGAPITGLTKEDFVVLVDGLQAEVATFAELDEGSEDTTRPSNDPPKAPLSIAIVFDLKQFRRDSLSEIVDDLISETETLLSNDHRVATERIAVASIGLTGLELVQPLTDDPALIALALRQAARGALGSTSSDYTALLSEVQSAAAAGSFRGKRQVRLESEHFQRRSAPTPPTWDR